MLECIEKFFLYSAHFDSVEDFVWHNDQLNYNASWSLLLAIGEESKRLSTSLKEGFPMIPWHSIAGMRNFPARDYRGIDFDLVYEVIHTNLPELKNVLIQIQMVDRIGYSESLLSEALKSPYYQHIQYLRTKLK
jgi:uncharacterized protein with HEPN domain